MNHPTGTVTFLFTDIEGSTRLAQKYRAAWEPLRSRHHAILREAIEAHEGYVFQIIGDAFCAAFSTAEAAIRAAAQAQAGLAAEEWPQDAPIRVRMGIHTGRAAIQENGEYQGYMAMSRVQRLVSLAQGGQVLLSQAAQDQACDDLPDQVTLRDLGEHGLKNIDRPERIYQLIIPGLQADFAALKGQAGFVQPPSEGLAVRLIGRFEIRLDGKPVHLSSRTAESLFAYLILNAGVPQRREKLAGMFWPDEPEEKARAYLRTELWRVRKFLAGSKTDYIVADSLNISFDPSSRYWLDADLLRNLDSTSSVEELKSALSPCEGELLPGFYDEWSITEREHLRAAYETGMVRLLGLLETEKRWHEILEWAERWIAHGQVPEDAYRVLMSAYDALGDRPKVADTYRRCVQALRQLDLEPSEQTRALALKRTSKLNLPVPLTSFIGRENELREVAGLISKSRLVTLTGSGGVGKTRLAIQVVADVLELFPDGVWFLDLAPITDPALVPNTLAKVLDLQLMGGSDLSMTDLIAGYLRSRRALIIFDNCEHLIDACADLVDLLLRSCKDLSILATSREVLRVSGEMPYRVPSLGVPELDIKSVMEALEQSESVRLFVERAAIVSPGFALGPTNALVIGRICQRLDGIPLAIELAAARVNVLSVEQILRRLDDRFNLLTGGSRSALPRHQTLRAAIEWSYELLTEKERLLFERLAVFIGGWTLEAGEAVCSGSGILADEVLDLLSQLVDKSLVLVENSDGDEAGGSGGSLRYRRLETIRQFASEKLSTSGEEEQIRALHLEYFLKLAEMAERMERSGEGAEWMQKLDDEHENLRLALNWSLEGNAKFGQDLALALYGWWIRTGYCVEGYEWMQNMLSVSAETGTLTKAKLLDASAWLAWHIGYSDQMSAFAQQSLILFRQLGDKEGMATSTRTLWARAMNRGDYEKAAPMLEEVLALWRETGNKRGLTSALAGAGMIAEDQGKFEDAQKLYDESMMLSKEIGYQEGIGWALYMLGGLALSQGDNAKAMNLFEQCLPITRAAKAKAHVTWVLNAMGFLAICSGDYARGRALLEETIELCEKVGDRVIVAMSLANLAWGEYLQGDYARARRLYIETLQLLPHLGNEMDLAEYLIGVGHLLAAHGDFGPFARLLGAVTESVPEFYKTLIPLFRSETDKYIQLARTALGDETFAAAQEAGRRMTLHEAAAWALQELQDAPG